MATMQDISFDELFAEPQEEQPQEDSLETLFGDVGNGATKMAAGIRPMADAAQQEAYRRADALAAAARSGGIRPRDDSMGAARRYAEHFARGQRAADAFGRTHVGSAALQARIDHERRAQDLERRKADQEAGIRRREIDMGVADTAYKNAGTLDPENARGMWGTADAAAGIAQKKLETRGGIREARINAAGRLGEAKMKADSEKEIEALRQKHEKEMEELRTKLGIDAATATSLIQRSDAEWYAKHPAGGGTPEPGDGVVRGVLQPNGSYIYEKNGAPVDYDPESAKPYTDMKRSVGTVDRLDKHGRKMGLLNGEYDLFWDTVSNRWTVLSKTELGKGDGPGRYQRGIEHDAETYWRIRASVRKEKNPKYSTT